MIQAVLAAAETEPPLPCIQRDKTCLGASMWRH